MNEDELDLSWAEGQIAAARVPVPVGKAVIELLKTWGELKFPNEHQMIQALDLFNTLGRNEAVVEETEAKWLPVHVGFNLRIGDTVRVRKDAFKDGAGRTHNGRVGRVLAKRSGDIIVRSTDGRVPYLDASHYPPSALELKSN